MLQDSFGDALVSLITNALFILEKKLECETRVPLCLL